MDVFTYGTLQLEEVWRRVALRRFATVAGHVDGFAAYRIQGVDYPGMTRRGDAVTRGTVYLGVDADALARLDRFEGTEYQRWTVPVQCEDGIVRDCQAYVVPSASAAPLTDEPWTLESFQSSGGLERFLTRYAGFSR